MANRASKKEAAALERLGSRRQEAEAAYSKLRESLNREMGSLAPGRAIWAIPLVAFAFGITLALRKKSRRQSS